MNAPVPRRAWLLGAAGLAPGLVALAAMLALPQARDLAASAGLAYAAVAAALSGGAWMGLAIAGAPPAALPRWLRIAALPVLVGWLAAMARPVAGFATLAFLFAVMPATDRRLVLDGVAPAWWLRLRRPLCFAMAALQAAAAVAMAL